MKKFVLILLTLSLTACASSPKPAPKPSGNLFPINERSLVQPTAQPLLAVADNHSAEHQVETESTPTVRSKKSKPQSSISPVRTITHPLEDN